MWREYEMKHFLPAVLLLLVFSGCSNKTAQPAEPVLTVSGTEITGETAVEDVLALLGEEYEYYEAISCVYDGLDKTYTYENYIVYTYPSEEGDHLMELYCTSDDVSAQGITVGASRDAVIETFGDGYLEEGAMLIYSLEPSSSNNAPASLYFELVDDTVTAVAMTTEHRVQ